MDGNKALVLLVFAVGLSIAAITFAHSTRDPISACLSLGNEPRVCACIPRAGVPVPEYCTEVMAPRAATETSR